MADQLPMFDLGPPPPAASADVEDAYRYRLMRRWGAPEPRVCWVMLNPSTAAESSTAPRGRAVMLLEDAVREPRSPHYPWPNPRSST